MNERSLHVLELPKLLQHLSSYAVSEAGKLACLSLKPYASFEQVGYESSLYTQSSVLFASTATKVGNFPALEVLLDSFSKRVSSFDIDAMWLLRDFLGQAKTVINSVIDSQNANESWPDLLSECSKFTFPSKIYNALYRCINDDALIKDEASPELYLVRSELRSIYQLVSKKVGDFIRKYNISSYLQDEYITVSSDRYVVPLKSNFKGRFQGVVHDYSQTGETCYFEPMFLVEINNKMQELKRNEREEERKVLEYLTSLILDESDDISTTYSFMVRMDLLQAKVRLADLYDGTIVRFSDSADIFLKEAYHPLLAIAGKQQETLARDNSTPSSSKKPRGVAKPVASDITLNPEQRALVISGGNAGGKTVCLKTLGLVALMGLCAIPVPVAQGSTLPFWDDIQAFIGDDQSLEEHVSTFTAQITQLSSGWASITSKSLVILDEFGAGTDPSQGAALAQAVIDGLMEAGAYVFAATHFPALKVYALSSPKVRAATVLFDPTSRKPLYKLVYDQVGASQALDVAKEHGLPESVLKRAQQYLLIDGEDTGALMDRLNSLAVLRENEAKKLNEERKSFESKRKNLDEKFARAKEDLYKTIQQEAQTVLHDWKASKVSHKQALKSLSTLRNSLKSESSDGSTKESSKEMDINSLAVGNSILYAPWGKNAVVTEIDTRRKRARIDISGVSMWADITDLSDAGQAKSPLLKPKSLSSGVSGSSNAGFALRVDLRGMRADVALAETAKFLDSAVLSGRELVEIIHGRGTGALRREIHAYLKDNSLVSSFTLANEDQGGDGVTVVTLK